MMEIHGTIHFKLILPHFPGFQQEPLPEPVCSRSPECKDCPYPRHGFLCWGADGTCLRSRMNEINEKKEDNDHDVRSSEYTWQIWKTERALSRIPCIFAMTMP